MPKRMYHQKYHQLRTAAPVPRLLLADTVQRRSPL